VLGITLGFHRLLTHRSFQTFKPVEYALAILGSMAVQGPVMNWVADHRKHHAHTDQEGDPHTPHGHGGGVKGALKGLWYAHMGWLFDGSGTTEHERYARELHEDRGMRFIHRTFGLWVALGIAIPAGAGFLLTGTARGALEAGLWGGPVRIFLAHHVTWSINSVCHFFGSRRFAVDDHSTNVFWLAPLSMGESWHHNHHTFPRSAFHGLKRWEIDPTGWVIRAMRRIRLAWNVVEITPERQRQKLA
jgi:stearoyl-CoA desaturase (delta-9 desaturase)